MLDLVWEHPGLITGREVRRRARHIRDVESVRGFGLGTELGIGLWMLDYWLLSG